MEASALAFLLSMPTSELLRRAKEGGLEITQVGESYEIDEFQALKFLAIPPQTPGQYVNDLLCAQGKTWDCLKFCIKGGQAQIRKLMTGRLPLSEYLVLHVSRILNVRESDLWQVQRRWDNYYKPFGSDCHPIKREERTAS